MPLDKVFGAPPVVTAPEVGHVPRGSTYLHMLLGSVIKASGLRRHATDTPENTLAFVLSAHDMQQHYLVAAAARPSPVPPHRTIMPMGCVFGRNCKALQLVTRMFAHAPNAPESFPLIGLISEEEMRNFYITGHWPTPTPSHPCVICAILVTMDCAIAISNLCPTARPGTVVFQTVYNDDDPETGFKPSALERPVQGQHVAERPMFRCSSECATVAMWYSDAGHAVPYIDISESCNAPVPFANMAVWTSDRKNAKGGPVVA